MDIDTTEAQQNVDQLNDTTKSVQETLETIGQSGELLGGSIAAGVGESIDSLNNMGNQLDGVGRAAEAVGNAGAAAGQRFSSAMDGAADSAGGVSDAMDDVEAGVGNFAKTTEQTGGRARQAFDNAAAASDRMGVSFAKNFNKAKESGNGFASSIKTGIVGAFDTAIKKAGSFVKETVGGAKKIGNALRHPVQTIKDKFSSAMKDAAGDTDKVGDKAKKSGKDLDDMGDSGGKAGDRLKTGFGAALGVIAAIAAAAAIITGLTKFVGAALEANKAAENISYSFDKAFGDSAPDVEGWADNFAGAVHRSGSEVRSFLTSNRQLYEGLGITGQAANDLSKATTSLAYDFGNKFGVEDSEALSKLQEAISGNADALSDYGVRLDDTTLKASAMAMGLGSNLDKLDEAAMAQVRFNAIMEQTGDIQQNASKSLGGLTGGVKAVKAVWTDFLEKAGAKLAPTFDKIFGVVLDAWPKVEPALMSFVELLAGGFEQAAPVLGDFASNLLPQLLGLASELLPMLMEVGGDLLPAVSQTLGTVVQSIGPLMPLIGTLAQTLLPPLLELFGTLVDKLLPPAAQLLGALSPVIEALSPVLQIAASAIGLVADAIAGLIGWLTQGIDKIGEFASGLKDTSVGKFVSGISDGINSAAGGVRSFFGGNAKGTENFEGGWTRIHEAGDEMIQAKHSGGVAYLPRGSAVIPASKTDEILSGGEKAGNVINITNLLQSGKSAQAADNANVPAAYADRMESRNPAPGWQPVLVQRDPPGTTDPDPKPEPDGGGEPKGMPPPDTNPNGGSPETPQNPSPAPVGAPREIVIRKVIEVNVTSSDGALSPSTIEEVKQIVQREVKQMEDDELDFLGIQDGVS